MSMIEPNTEVPTTLQGTPWSGLPHTHEQWIALRQQGMRRYLVRAKTTWGFFLVLGVINPLVALLILGTQQGAAYAITGVLVGLLGGFWMSRIIWQKCETAFALSDHAKGRTQ